MKKYQKISKRLGTMLAVATFAVLLGAAAPPARADSNWDGDNAVGNFGITDNWYGNSAGGLGGYGFGGSLHFSIRNNSSQTSQYQNVGWQNEDNIYWDSGWPVDTAFNSDGSGINFNQRIENNSSHIITVNCPTSGAKNGATQIELNPVNGDLIINGNVFNDNNKPFYVYGANSKILTIGTGLTGNSSVGLTLAQYSKVKLTAAQSWGDSTHGVNINQGEFWIDSGGSLASSSIPITVGLSDGNVAKLWLSVLTGGQTLNNNIAVNNQSSTPAEKTIGGLNTSGTSIFGGTVTLNGQVNLSAATGGTVTFGGVISGTSQNVVVNGYGLPLAGTIITSAANTYSGNTYISGGTLQFNSGGSAANSPSFYLGEISGSQSATLTLGATGGGQTVNNPITVRSGSSGTKTIRSLAASSTSTLGGNIALNDNLTINSASGGNLILSGIISGTGFGITTVFPGTITLSGANTFTGGTTFGGSSTLNINNSSALGTSASTFTFSGGTAIDNTSGSAITTLNYPMAWNTDVRFLGASDGTHDLNLGTGAVTLSGNRTVTIDSGNLTVAGTIGGAFSLIKRGPGTLTLSGASTFVNGGNGAELWAGQLNINYGGSSAANSAIGTGNLTIQAGTTIDNTSGSPVALKPNNQQSWNGNFTFLGAVDGTHDLNLGTGAVFLGGACQVTVNAGNLTVGGNILGAPAYTLIKAGAGRLTVTGNSSYSGTTTINAGELIGQTGGQSVFSAFTVSSGATNGVKRATANGQWSCGGLTYNAGTTYADFDFGSFAPSTSVAPLNSGALTANSTVNVILRNVVYPATVGNYPLIRYSGAAPSVSSFSLLSSLPLAVTNAAGTLVLDTGNNNVSIQVGLVVPNLTYTIGAGTGLRILKTDITANSGLHSSQTSPAYSITGVSAVSVQGGTVASDANTIQYTPLNSSITSDSFSYTLSDGSLSATATVTLTLIKQTGTYGTISVSGGVANVTLYGIPGLQYDVQRSTDLSAWTTLLAAPPLNTTPPITAGLDGKISFTDNFSDLGSAPSSAYYRTIQH